MVFFYGAYFPQEHLEGHDTCIFLCPSNQQFKNIGNMHLSSKSRLRFIACVAYNTRNTYFNKEVVTVSSLGRCAVINTVLHVCWLVAFLLQNLEQRWYVFWAPVFLEYVWEY